MRSTWMDPLISVQHAKRPTPQAEFDEESLNAPKASSEAPERGCRSLQKLDHELADWDQDLSDTLPELELAIGISDWIDPETGSPAEGQSPLHIEFE